MVVKLSYPKTSTLSILSELKFLYWRLPTSTKVAQRQQGTSTWIWRHFTLSKSHRCLVRNGQTYGRNKKNRYRMRISTGHNTGLAKVAVQCYADTFVVNQSLVLRSNICGENRHLRQARKRYLQAITTH